MSGKRNALHDKIMIDGTDVSNLFKQFGLDSTDSEQDASGFSATGTDEVLQGTRAQGFSGQAFNTSDLRDLLWQLHNDRATFEVWWQEDGLTDPTGDVFYANCNLFNFSPSSVRGQVKEFPVNFKVTDANGITKATAT